jgi:hypothetical protein
MNKPQIKSLAPGILPGINPEDLKHITCKCGSTRFIPVCELRLASRFQTNVGQPMLINFQGGYACIKCGQVNQFDTGNTPDAKPQESVN